MWFSLEILFEYEALSKISLQTKIMLAFLLRSKNKNQGKRALTLQQQELVCEQAAVSISWFNFYICLIVLAVT